MNLDAVVLNMFSIFSLKNTKKVCPNAVSLLPVVLNRVLNTNMYHSIV